MPQPIKKCPQCKSFMKRGPVQAEINKRIVVLSRYKLFDCTKCDYNEVVEVKLRGVK